MFSIHHRTTGEIIRAVANPQRIDLSWCSLRAADLRDCDLRCADFSHADLRSSDLRGADLRGADLSFASLSYSDLRGADLRGAEIRHARFCGANITSAMFPVSGLDTVDFRDAIKTEPADEEVAPAESDLATHEAQLRFKARNFLQ